MFRLTVIAGPNRGTSYSVQEGETTIGRQAGNSVVLPSSKVSKKHCVLVVSDGEVIIKDQGSSNGTFVNGILTKARKVKSGDRLSVGEYVFELRQPSERAPRAAPAVAGLGNVIQFPGSQGMGGLPAPGGLPSSMGSGMGGISGQPNATSRNEMPKDLKGRAIWLFENRVMPVFYGLNLKHEWRILVLGMFGAFVLANLVISVYPLIESNRVAVVREAGKRASFMAKMIAERNAPYLAARAETKTEVGSIENADGVRVAVLTDMDVRVLAPGNRMGQFLASGAEAVVAVRARDAFRGGRETGLVFTPDTDTLVAVEPVKVVSPTAGRNVVVGMAVVSVDTSLYTPDLGEMGMIYSETLILTGVLALAILLILYRMTLKPFQVLNEDMDRVLKGDMGQVTHEFKMEEMNSLWEIINSALQRVPRGADGGSSDLGGGMGGGNPEEYVAPLRALGGLLKSGIVLFDQDKKVLYMNAMFEEMSGIRLDSAMGQDIGTVARDQSLGQMVQDLFSRAPVGGEGIVEDYDFSGISCKLVGGAFGPPGGTGKAYLLAAVKAEG